MRVAQTVTLLSLLAIAACGRSTSADEKVLSPATTADTDLTIEDTDPPVEDTDPPIEDTDPTITDPPIEDTDLPIEDTGVAPPAISNLQVQVAGVWEGICCVAGVPRLSAAECTWTEYDRILTDETAGAKLFCPEGNPAACTCDATGEHLHGYGGGNLVDSILAVGGGPVYPDELIATCVFVAADGALVSDWTSGYCPYFQLDQAP